MRFLVLMPSLFVFSVNTNRLGINRECRSMLRFQKAFLVGAQCADCRRRLGATRASHPLPALPSTGNDCRLPGSPGTTTGTIYGNMVLRTSESLPHTVVPGTTEVPWSTCDLIIPCMFIDTMVRIKKERGRSAAQSGGVQGRGGAVWVVGRRDGCLEMC